ncbi:hypothetical protein ACOMHN_016886 [Nucella lapillus]
MSPYTAVVVLSCYCLPLGGFLGRGHVKAQCALVLNSCRHGFRTFLRLLTFVVIFGMLAFVKLVFFIPPLMRAVENHMKKEHPEFQVSFFTWTGVAVIAYNMTLNVFKPCRQGRPALDVTLHTLTGETTSLLQQQKPGRPLVVNVGSCS